MIAAIIGIISARQDISDCFLSSDIMLRGDSFHDRQRALDSGQFIWPKRVAFSRILPGQLAVACNTCFTPECSFLGGTYFNPLKTTLVRCKKVQAHHPSFNDNFHSSRPIPAIFGAFITECMCHRKTVSIPTSQ